MKFHLIGKDFRENWTDERFRETLAWCDQMGMIFRTPITGDCVGVDMDFIVITDEELEDIEEQATEMIQLGLYDIEYYRSKDRKERENAELLESMKKKKRKNCILFDLLLQDGREYQYVDTI